MEVLRKMSKAPELQEEPPLELPPQPDLPKCAHKCVLARVGCVFARVMCVCARGMCVGGGGSACSLHVRQRDRRAGILGELQAHFRSAT